MPDSTVPSVVLIGAGHAHLYSLKRAVAFRERGAKLTVIAPENFWYSGLATGVLGGTYAPEEDQVDVEKMIRVAGGSFVKDRVTRIEPESKRLHLASGATVSYDWLSINLGSETRPLPGQAETVFDIKPLRNLWRLRQALEAKGPSARVLIAGGGASGCEIAANVRELLGPKAAVGILLNGMELASEFPRGTAAILRRWLDSKGIALHPDSAVERIDGSAAITKNGARHEFDFLVNATGLRAPRLLADAGLQVNGRGEMLIDATLRSTGDLSVFGGGDAVQMRDRTLARIGVYAVRQAPVLFHNLLASISGEPLQLFHPQKHYLQILNLGDKTGLATWRRLHWLGHLPFLLKDRIDRSFVRRYQNP